TRPCASLQFPGGTCFSPSRRLYEAGGCTSRTRGSASLRFPARRVLAAQQRVANPLGPQAKGPCSEYEVDRVPLFAALCARSDQQVLDFASRRCRIPNYCHCSVVLFSKCPQYRGGLWFL